MYTELAEFYRGEIFPCQRCRQPLMNPYRQPNLKHDPPGRSLADNRRRFLLDYIGAKKDVGLVVIGEAPGLDGCGYGGIPFTGEENAVNDLGLANYHGSAGRLQREQSANMLYGALRASCQKTGTHPAAAARRLYFTNAVLCVPLAANGRSLTSPNPATLKQCRENLVRQIEILKPRLLLTLGANALKAVAAAYGLEVQGKLTELAGREPGPLALANGLSLIPEIHPSPRNRALGQLYLQLPARLEKVFALFI